MAIFEFLRQPDINQGVYEFLRSKGAVLLDVRTSQEYSGGHIPGSKNVPLQTIDEVEYVADNKDTKLYVYCHSGARSRQAVNILKYMGYTDVQNIGGIIAYKGKVSQPK